MKYDVRLKYWYHFVVDADCETEAIEIARELEPDATVSCGEEEPIVKELGDD